MGALDSIFSLFEMFVNLREVTDMREFLPLPQVLAGLALSATPAGPSELFHSKCLVPALSWQCFTYYAAIEAVVADVSLPTSCLWRATDATCSLSRSFLGITFYPFRVVSGSNSVVLEEISVHLLLLGDRDSLFPSDTTVPVNS